MFIFFVSLPRVAKKTQIKILWHLKKTTKSSKNYQNIFLIISGARKQLYEANVFLIIFFKLSLKQKWILQQLFNFHHSYQVKLDRDEFYVSQSFCLIYKFYRKG